MAKKKEAAKQMTAPSAKKIYSSEIASTGQTDAQAPQLTQLSAFTLRFPSASLIAPEGHSLSHAPQLMHSSDTLYAISNLLM